MTTFKNKINTIIANIMLSEEYRFRVQTFVTCLISFFIGLLMFILNTFTHTRNLQLITGFIAIVGISMTTYIYITKKILLPRIVSFFMFFIIMISFFYTGGIDGFSPYWACLLPFISIYLYGTKLGTAIAILMWLVIVLMLWTPLVNHLQFDYSKAFIMRYPFLYIGFMISTLSTEFIRRGTFLQLKKANATLEKLSLIDELTHIENRRAFEIRINELWNLFAVKENYISILMIDIDNFKNYNDFYGHLQGDLALKSVASILSDIVNKYNSYVSRWGGEEFICLLPFSDKTRSTIIANNILTAIENANIPHEKTILDHKVLTVSIGCCSVNITNSVLPNSAIELADKSLYEAKSSGKNCLGTCKEI